jgi:hypothetical protein
MILTSRYRKTRSYIDQCRALTECRRDIPAISALPANLQRWTLAGMPGGLKAHLHRSLPSNG